MTINELTVASKEQSLVLYNGYVADIKFDAIYKRWYYDLYQNGELKYAGIALNPNTAPLVGVSPYSLGVVDRLDDKDFYEPYNELGVRLALLEFEE